MIVYIYMEKYSRLSIQDAPLLSGSSIENCFIYRHILIIKIYVIIFNFYITEHLYRSL
jgi:hypothetical protein